MLSNHLIVERSVLPDYFIKVVEARRLLESGAYTQVSDAVRAVGISRSTYYKYKDKIMESAQLNIGRRASLMLTLTHEAGMLSRVLSAISDCGANILTITQSLPIHGKASIMLTLDMASMDDSAERLPEILQNVEGVEKVRLLAVE